MRRADRAPILASYGEMRRKCRVVVLALAYFVVGFRMLAHMSEGLPENSLEDVVLLVTFTNFFYTVSVEKMRNC